jgi:hypothetical protein
MEQRRTILDPVLVTAEHNRCACRCWAFNTCAAKINAKNHQS